MDTILRGWSTEKVMLLADSPMTARAARRLAVPDRWLSIGHDMYSAWGELRDDDDVETLQVCVDFFKIQREQRGTGCDCSDSGGCEHALALLFLLIEKPDHFREHEPPAYLTDWLDKSARRARRLYERQQDGVRDPLDPAQRQQQFQDRYERIAAGVEELDSWLVNLIRHGLADERVQRYDFWDSIADRMVDARAPGLARWLRRMGGIPAAEHNWIEPLLGQAGRLYLVVESFKRFQELDHELQADLRAVLGWHLKPEEVLKRQPVSDRWLVIGSHEQQLHDRFRTQRLWLRGKHTGRDALIQEFAFGDALFETYLLAGQSLDADLVYYPSRYPLRAFLLQRNSAIHHDHNLRGESIMTNIRRYSAALARNPWLAQMPFMLHTVTPVQSGQSWCVREPAGTSLPVARRFQHHWSLLALSGGYPIQVMGEWDGEVFLPLSAIADSRFVDFNRVGSL